MKRSTIRLYPDQIERLKKAHPMGGNIIRFAVKRYENNEFKIEEISKEDHSQRGKLDFFYMRGKPDGFTDSQIRMILDSHFKNPIDHSKEIEQLDREIEFLFKQHNSIIFLDNID